MMRYRRPVRFSVALFGVWILVLYTTVSVVGAQTSAATAKPSSSPATAKAQPVDGGWPRMYMTPSGGEMILYQPQVASWEKQKHAVTYSVVSHTAKGATKPQLGTIRLEAETLVSVEERLVRFAGMRIAEASFPGMDKEVIREVVAEIDKAIPDDERVIGLDRVLAALDRSQILPKNVEGVKADPPKIFYSKSKALLVVVDGKPIWSPIPGNDLKYLVNTNWDLFQHEPTSTFFLRDEKFWLRSSDLAGPWSPAGKLPESFSKLPADDNWKDVREALPGSKLDPKKVPAVYLSQEPAEVILTEGDPAYQPVAGASALLWVGNTESDLFRLGRSGAFYYLVAGRWFSASDLAGPWTFATPSLPAELQKIPLEHARSRVLASVPGTQQAAEAVLLAQVPQTARVNIKQTKAPEVAYGGEPKFEPIEKTSLQRAVNTDKAIIKVGDMYYMCFEGVWFMGKSPEGPWTVASTVPNEIYTIPASDPAHNVTYVTVEDSDDDWTTFASVAGYTGMMVAWGCAVSGSGWYYPPYVGWGGAYYGHYPTYGYGAHYNPWTGAYGAGGRVYGPYGGAGYGAAYNPRTGTYARGAAAYGPGGSRYAGTAYNPRSGAYGATRGGSNVYGSWNQTAVQRGDSWAQSSRYTNKSTGTTTRATTGSGGGGAVTRHGPQGSGFVGKTGSGDVYAGHDGNVYRKQGDSFQKYDNGSWSGVQQPSSAQRDQARSQAQTRTQSVDRGTYDQLSRDSSARSAGTQRTRDYSNYRSSGGSRGGGAASYRSSGGGRMRGGGGGRRR